MTICIVAILCDVVVASQHIPLVMNDPTRSGLNLAIHDALAFYVLVIEDCYMVIYLYMLRGYTSWAFFRLCMALDGVVYLLAIVLLRALGEDCYPPDSTGFVESLARPANSLLLAALFNQPVRTRIHALSLAAGLQHAPVYLDELKRDEVDSLISPTAAANALREDRSLESKGSIDEQQPGGADDACKDERKRADNATGTASPQSHHTAKVGNERFIPIEHPVVSVRGAWSQRICQSSITGDVVAENKSVRASSQLL